MNIMVGSTVAGRPAVGAVAENSHLISELQAERQKRGSIGKGGAARQGIATKDMPSVSYFLGYPL